MNELEKRSDNIVKKQLFFERENLSISARLVKTFTSIYIGVEDLVSKFIDKKINSLQFQQESEKLIDSTVSTLDSKARSEAMKIINKEIKDTSEIINLTTSLGKEKISGDTLKLLQNEVIKGNKFFTVEFTKYKSIAKSRILASVNSTILNAGSYDDAVKLIGQTKLLNESQLRTVSRTMMRSVQTDTATKVFERNGINLVKFAAILDSRTTSVCKDLNGKVFELNKAPRLGLHYNCRSHYIPIFDDEEDLYRDSVLTWADFYQRNKEDPDLKRLKYVY